MFQSVVIFVSLLVSSGSFPAPQVDNDDAVGDLRSSEPQVAATDCECGFFTLMDKRSGKRVIRTGKHYDYLCVFH